MRRKKWIDELPLIKCECGYNNKIENVDRYGTCRCCGKTLDKKRKYDYEMFCKLHLWVKDKQEKVNKKER